MSENYPRKNLYHWVGDGAIGEVVEVLSFRTAVRGGGMHFVHEVCSALCLTNCLAI